jgi:hypothetical protein
MALDVKAPAIVGTQDQADPGMVLKTDAFF